MNTTHASYSSACFLLVGLEEACTRDRWNCSCKGKGREGSEEAGGLGMGIIPGSPISPSTSPALPGSSLETMPARSLKEQEGTHAISLSLSAPAHGGDRRGRF